jgi:rfaE bifunctional protein kinase chain/domain
MSTVQEIFSSFSNQNVLIIGDAMVDAYRWGTIERMSPEAPVPVVSVHKSENRLGGAANVALNIKALGGNATLCSIIGTDSQGVIFKELMQDANLSTQGLIEFKDRCTTVKTRVISDNKHVLRLDEEDCSEISEVKLILDKINGLIDSANFDVIIFEDYNKGMLSEEVIGKSISLANSRNVPTLVDPKKKNFLAYKGVTLFKPNLKELAEGIGQQLIGSDLKRIEKAVTKLRLKLNAKGILLTLSEFGVFIQSKDGQHIVPAFKRNIIDVSGAGDTVVAVAAMTLAATKNDKLIATISNLAGGLVCEYSGVVPIDKDLLFEEANKYLGECL